MVAGGQCDGGGEPAQLYSLNAAAYESLMVGMHYIHRGPNNGVCEKGKFPKLIDLELGFSRDGFHWDRPDRRGFIVGSRTEGSWDRAYLHGTAGVFAVLDDQLVFPYMGTSGIQAVAYALAVLALLGTAKVAAALLVVGIPVIDAFFVIVGRILAGRSPYSAETWLSPRL